jgi:hypothetical protein
MSEYHAGRLVGSTLTKEYKIELHGIRSLACYIVDLVCLPQEILSQIYRARAILGLPTRNFHMKAVVSNFPFIQSSQPKPSRFSFEPNFQVSPLQCSSIICLYLCLCSYLDALISCADKAFHTTSDIHTIEQHSLQFQLKSY